MKIHLKSLVDACVEAHIKANTTKEAIKQFKVLIQYAYDLGVEDEKRRPVPSSPCPVVQKEESRSQGQKESQGEASRQSSHQKSSQEIRTEKDIKEKIITKQDANLALNQF